MTVLFHFCHCMALRFSLSFSQGHNSVSQCSNAQDGYCSFSYCILMQYMHWTETPGLQKNIIKRNFVDSYVLLTEDELKLQNIILANQLKTVCDY